MENNKKLALGVGLYHPEVTRDKEYEAVLVAGARGYDKVLGDRYSDEQVYLVQGELYEGGVDDSTPQSLEDSLQAQGYEVVDLFTWLETQPTKLG